MSLNSVVNNLVRAAAGISPDISDAELDAHVARLLTDEAKARESKWSELGLVGLLRDQGRDSPDASLPKTNKRFLASVIRTVDGHNSALLKAQAQAARDARDERLGETSRSARSSGPSRLFGGALKGMSREAAGSSRGARARDQRQSRGDDIEHYNRSSPTRHRPDEGREHDRYQKGERKRDDERSRRREDSADQEQRRRKSDRSFDEEEGRSSHRSKRYDFEDEYDRRREREHDDQSRSSSSRKAEEASFHRSHTRNGAHRGASPPRASKPLTPPSSRPTSVSSSRSSSPPPAHISKMDRYFETSYDPRLDLPAVPAQGLVQEVGWDNMLAILKERGKKRRQQSPALSDTTPAPPPGVLPKRSYSPDTLARKIEKREKKARKEEKKKRRVFSDSEDEREREKRKERRRKEKERGKEGEGEKGKGTGKSSLLDGYEYVKKGGTREWDVGK